MFLELLNCLLDSEIKQSADVKFKQLKKLFYFFLKSAKLFQITLPGSSTTLYNDIS